jgi:hypothetical protein
MMKNTKKFRFGRGLLLFFFSLILLFVCNLSSNGQEKPPRPIQVNVKTAGDLHFGAFCHGPSGGTLTMLYGGTRVAGGDVIPLNLGYTFGPAIFEVSGIKGTIISITDNSSTAFTLSGSNGGSLTLHMGTPSSNTDSGTPFVLNAEYPFKMEVRVGGILSVGNSAANPPGSYSGTFSVTFNQE